MLRQEIEGRQSFPSLHYHSTMKEEPHLNGLHPNGHFLPRRHSSLASGSAMRVEKSGRSSRSNSMTASSSTSPTQMQTARLMDLSKRRSSITKLAKERKDSSSSTSTEQYSFVVLGVGGVGKTALIVRYVTGRFLHEYDPTLEMTYEKELEIGENTVSLGIMDTAGNGQASYIKQGDGFIVVYSITDYYSFEVARQLIKLIKQVRHTNDFCQVPIVLVGNKRDSRRGRIVSKSEAREVASEYGCSHYETSALTNRNVNMVFYNMVFQARFTKASNRESRKSHASPSHSNGFLSSVKQLFHPSTARMSRRGSLPS